MFRAAPMLQLSVLVLERDQRAVLQELGRLGAVQLARKPAGPATAPLPPRDRTGELARCCQLLVRTAELRRNLAIAGTEEAAALTFEEAEPVLESLEALAAGLLHREEHLAHRLSELNAMRERLSPFCGVGFPLRGASRFEILRWFTGSLPLENLEGLQQEIGNQAAVLPLAPKENRLPLVVLTTRESEGALAQALQRAGFQSEPLPEIEGATVDSLSGQCGREQQEVASEWREVKAQIDQLALHAAAPLATIERLAHQERCLLEAAQSFPRTETAFLLTGWVPATEAPAVERRLREITLGKCVCQTADPEEVAGEPVPVLLRHPRLLRPFERLVAAYGLPRYGEVEPTLFVALSFVGMFGMMFGDAGQGLVLAVAGWLALAKGRKAKVRDWGALLLFAGVSSIVFGAVYGSYFGLAPLKRYALWHDPLEGEALALMRCGIGVGVVMISLGLVLNMLNRFQSGDVLAGLLGQFGVAGALFYWGMLGLATRFEALQELGMAGPMLLLCAGVPIAGWTLKGPLECMLRPRAQAPGAARGGLLAAVAESLVEAFEAVLSYLANTISFVRLAAYAMSHAALLAATDMIAGEVRRASVVGGVLVIICGNLVAMVLEAVVACVQALRLEYYEFFGKFFSGAGQAFKPFRLVEPKELMSVENDHETVALAG